MVAFKSLAAVLSLCSVTTLAAPADTTAWRTRRNAAPSSQKCMTTAEVNQVAALYGELIANYSNETAEAILAPNFIDYSESVNTLITSCPQGDAAMFGPQPGLLDPTFTSRLNFMVGQGQQPKINFIPLNVWNSCREVIIRWETNNTATRPISDEKPIIGIIVATVEEAPAGNQYPWAISTVYSEFDAGAWLANLQASGTCGGPGGPPAPAAQGPPAPAPAMPSPVAPQGPAAGSGPGAASSSPVYYNSTSTAYAAIRPTGTTNVYETPVVHAY